MEDFAAFGFKIQATCENGSGSDSEALGVLMNGRMQLGKNRFDLGSVLCGNSVAAKFPDAVIESSTAQAHSEKRPVSKMSGYLLE